MDALPDDGLRRKAELAQRIGPLKDDERFQDLKAVVEKKRTRVVEALARTILASGEVDPVRLAYERGYWDGAMHVLNRPENAEEVFNKALKRLEEGTSE